MGESGNARRNWILALNAEINGQRADLFCQTIEVTVTPRHVDVGHASPPRPYQELLHHEHEVAAPGKYQITGHSPRGSCFSLYPFPRLRELQPR